MSAKNATMTSTTINTKTFGMPDIFNGIGDAFSLKGGLAPILLGVLSTITINLLQIDLSAIATAIPLFISTIGAVGTGVWYTWKKKKIELGNMRERQKLDSIKKLVDLGIIPAGATPEEKLEILKKFSSEF